MLRRDLPNARIKISLSVLLLLMAFFSSINVWAFELDTIDNLVEEFTTNLETEIQRIISNAIGNTTNLISNQTVTYPKVSINGFINSTTGINSSQIVFSNGFCSATLIAGIGNNTLASHGNCDDQLVGGPGADKFFCGNGIDIIRDYSPEQGDSIVDKANCENIM
ncbi:MAG: hypothetical protein ACRD8W_01710 [Nitrososphaeraceae archaeon]